MGSLKLAIMPALLLLVFSFSGSVAIRINHGNKKKEYGAVEFSNLFGAESTSLGTLAFL